MNEAQKCLQRRAIAAAGEALYKNDYVSPIDVFIGMHWLKPSDVEDWRKGKVPYLEKVIQGSLGKLTQCMKYFRAWATSNKMKPSMTVYRERASKKDLRFSKNGHPTIEEAYRTHYISPKLIAIKKQRLQEALQKELQEKEQRQELQKELQEKEQRQEQELQQESQETQKN